MPASEYLRRAGRDLAKSPAFAAVPVGMKGAVKAALKAEQAAYAKSGGRRPTQSELETDFAAALVPWVSIPTPVREWRFHTTRRWRFDFAWPQHMVAVEIDGLVWHAQGKGRHQTVQGIVADCEKYEAAHLLGWFVYRVPGPWVADSQRLQETLGNLRLFLKRAETPRCDLCGYSQECEQCQRAID